MNPFDRYNLLSCALAANLTGPDDYWEVTRVLQLGFTRGYIDQRLLQSSLSYTWPEQVLIRWPLAKPGSGLLVHAPTLLAESAAELLGAPQPSTVAAGAFGAEGKCPFCFMQTPVATVGSSVCISCSLSFDFKGRK